MSWNMLGEVLLGPAGCCDFSRWYLHESIGAPWMQGVVSPAQPSTGAGLSSVLCMSLASWERWLGPLVERKPDWKARQDPPVQESRAVRVLVRSVADAPFSECSFPGASLRAEAGGWWQSCLPPRGSAARARTGFGTASGANSGSLHQGI